MSFMMQNFEFYKGDSFLLYIWIKIDMIFQRINTAYYEIIFIIKHKDKFKFKE